MKEHEPDTACRHASLLLHILSCAFTDDTRGSLHCVQKYESSTGAVESGTRAKRSQRHFVVHAS